MAGQGHGSRAALVIRTGDFEGTRYELAGEETLIGRNPTTDITLLDEGISREHALILFDDDHGALQHRGPASRPTGPR